MVRRSSAATDIGGNAGGVTAAQACLPDGATPLSSTIPLETVGAEALLILSTPDAALTFTLDAEFASYAFDVGEGCEDI